MNITAITVNKTQLDMNVYITKHKDLKYLHIPHKKGTCPICNEEKKVKAHHLIPKRLTNRKGLLGELRVKICSDCHDKIHPENRYVEIVRRLIIVLEKIYGNEIKNLAIWDEVKKVAKGRDD